MKSLFLAALTVLSVFSSSIASASQADISVLKVEQFANLMPPTRPGGPHARTSIHLTYKSCAAFNEKSFIVQLDYIPGGQTPSMDISIDPNQMDCMGPSRLRLITIHRATLPLIERVFVPQNGKMVELLVEQNIVH